jgi:hypothetical protein
MNTESGFMSFGVLHGGVFEDSCLVGCDAASLGNSFFTFQMNMFPSSSRIQGP